MSKEQIRETPVKEMTAGQLADFIAGELGSQAPRAQGTEPVQPRRYRYGLKGIMQLFNVSNVTAQRYKKGVIREAVKQYGRIIVVDEDLALQLFKERQKKTGHD